MRTKQILFACALVCSVAQANAFTKLVCEIDADSYGMSAVNLVLPLESADESEEKGSIILSLSESECEDSSEIKISETEDIAAYKANKTFSAYVKHEGPDSKVEGYASCAKK